MKMIKINANVRFIYVLKQSYIRGLILHILCTRCIKLLHNEEVMSVCLSVCLHVSSLKLLNVFRLNLVLEVYEEPG